MREAIAVEWRLLGSLVSLRWLGLTMDSNESALISNCKREETMRWSSSGLVGVSGLKPRWRSFDQWREEPRWSGKGETGSSATAFEDGDSAGWGRQPRLRAAQHCADLKFSVRAICLTLATFSTSQWLNIVHKNLWDNCYDLKNELFLIIKNSFCKGIKINKVIVEDTILKPVFSQKTILMLAKLAQISTAFQIISMETIYFSALLFKNDIEIIKIKPRTWISAAKKYYENNEKDSKKLIKSIVSEHFVKDFSKINKIIVTKGKQDILDSYLMARIFYLKRDDLTKKANIYLAKGE